MMLGVSGESIDAAAPRIRRSKTMSPYARTFAVALAALLMLSALPAAPDAGEWAPTTATDPNFIAAKKAIDAKEWKKAIDLLNKVRVNADVHNYLGYAYRHLGNYKEAFHNYGRALEIDPAHRGAHEYVGEAYLLTDNLPKAEEHLAALNRLCGTSCEEYRDLAREIAAYKKKRA
jgi:tetratricopeptide (TPR) repeat protein